MFVFGSSSRKVGWFGAATKTAACCPGRLSFVSPCPFPNPDPNPLPQTFLVPTTAALSQSLAPAPQFKSAGTFEVEGSKAAKNNPEEMDLDLDEFDVQEGAVPEAVFGDALKRKRENA